jgi:hypothetical protein
MGQALHFLSIQHRVEMTSIIPLIKPSISKKHKTPTIDGLCLNMEAVVEGLPEPLNPLSPSPSGRERGIKTTV